MITDQQRWKEIVRDAQESIEDSDGYEADRAIVWANERITELEKAHVRYEAVRKLNHVQFAKLCQMNISTGQAFDTLVDRLAKGEFAL
jgi:S-adenosylhomocysteine hydrolase